MSSALEVRDLLRQRLAGQPSRQGGWPFSVGCNQPALEPTCLGLLALRGAESQVRNRAIHFLLSMRNPNGSWPAFVGDDANGCGLTGLALYALQRCGIRNPATERAIRWLLALQGWESHWLWKWKFRTTDRHVRFDPDKFGWPWTPETVSWVVPTAYALLALKQRSPETELARFRIRWGVEMLFDRICPNGGWNAGNGVVYGEPMTPHIDATALALLALQNEPPSQLVAMSLDWLRRRAQECFAPWSLAWAVLALGAFGLPVERLLARLVGISVPGEIRDYATAAIVVLGLDCAVGRNVFMVTG